MLMCHAGNAIKKRLRKVFVRPGSWLVPRVRTTGFDAAWRFQFSEDTAGQGLQTSVVRVILLTVEQAAGYGTITRCTMSAGR